VRRLLARTPEVRAFTDAPPERGGWGATLVAIVPEAETAPPRDASKKEPAF